MYIEQAAAPKIDPGPPPERDEGWRSWMMVAVGLVGLFALLATIAAVFAVARSGADEARASAPVATQEHARAAATTADTAAPTLAEAKGVAFEKFQPVDPTLPAVPPGPVKKFKVDVYQHVTQVSADLAPTEVWSFAVNGVEHRGTGVSQPMVVTEGDTVDFTFVNGTSKKMGVTMPHSVDFHSAEVNPGTRYVDVAPGKSMHYRFVAKHPGVFMYHCATQPVLMHTGAGMVGMFVVKPKGLPHVDRELWMTQQEYYIGAPGKSADMAKMQAEKPDVIAFNGYAMQYRDNPVPVKRGEKVRLYVLNAGPSIWSAFHVIGTVFDTAHTDNGIAHDVQTVNLAPSQGGWVEFTLDEEGAYPFLTHAFGDAGKGAIGVLKTAHAPAAMGHDMGGGSSTGQASSAKADVNVTLGDMWVKTDKPTVKAGKVTFAVKNTGATVHGLAISPTPVEQSGGMLDDSALAGKGTELQGGGAETVTWSLKPGSYELVCFMPGHYAAGQKLPFTVQ